MTRLLFTIIAGILLGGVVHLVSVLALPRIASQDAYSRLTPITKLNAVTPLPLAEPGNTLMPFMDPAFATAICRSARATAWHSWPAPMTARSRSTAAATWWSAA